MMLRPCLAAALLALAACDSPSPEFAGLPAERVVVGQSTFSVRVRAGRAEAIRLNFEAGRQARGVMTRGARAMQRASGCAVEPGSLEGDPAMMRADLDCAAS